MDTYEKLKRKVLATFDWSPAVGAWCIAGCHLQVRPSWEMIAVVKIKDGWVCAERAYWTRAHYRLGKFRKALRHPRREFWTVRDWQHMAAHGTVKKATTKQTAAWLEKQRAAQVYQPPFRPSIYAT